MGVDAFLVCPHVVDALHHQEFVLQRLERLQDTVKAFPLQGSRDPQAKKNVERADGHRSSFRGSVGQHFFEQGQTNRHRAEPSKHRSPRH